MNRHAERASVFLQDKERSSWQDHALWQVRMNRDRAAGEVKNWEELREIASAIKENTLDNLHDYLIQFESNAKTNGWIVHWASDADSHNSTILDILKEEGIDRVVKSKSMLTEECGLNRFLENHQITVTDTDLGERIVQLGESRPSHIVLPAIHLQRKEIGELFQAKLGADPGNNDADYLTGIARKDLREKFFHPIAAISGVNFALADTGGIVICTNEGNSDMGIHHAGVYIACMGIEKIIPGKEQLPVFLKLLARSATGQSLTAYTSHFIKPPDGKKYHLILVDNGRSKILKEPKYREALKCIRCGACMNTCPVYRRSGGFSYGYTIPGPIGSVLAPLKNFSAYSDLPYASSLCGSCTDVCPVKINLHTLLYDLRKEAINRKEMPMMKRLLLQLMGWVLYYTWLYRAAGKLFRLVNRHFPRKFIYNSWNPWAYSREMPVLPRQTFRSWYKINKDG